jgi:acyl-CoA thioester hydrolase
MTDLGPSPPARIRVRYAETDQMGFVYHANYIVWMEVGRVEYCRAAGLSYRDMEAGGVRLAVVEATCRYIHPARYDDEIEIFTSVAKANSRMVEFHYAMKHAGSGKLLAEGLSRHIFLNHEMRPARLPEAYHALFGITVSQPA